jgi:hypothetical protein
MHLDLTHHLALQIQEMLVLQLELEDASFQLALALHHVADDFVDVG